MIKKILKDNLKFLKYFGEKIFENLNIKNQKTFQFYQKNY